MARYMPWRLRDARNVGRLPPERIRVRRMFGSLLPKMRAAAVARDGYRCRHCLRHVVRHWKYRTPPDDHLTVDHVVPRSHGGTNSIHNLVVSCYACNQFRRDLMRRKLPLPAPIPLEAGQMVRRTSA
jgi:5-methylcytosine-specific restriction endonuclease McrA